MSTLEKPTPIEQHMLFDWIELAKKGFFSIKECESYLAKELWSKETFDKVTFFLDAGHEKR